MSVTDIGRVIRIDSKVCWVRLEDGTLLKCPVRGRLFRAESTAKNPVAVGDRVEVMRGAGTEDSGSVESVLPRSNKLSRPVVASAGRKEQVIVANVDYLVVVGSAARPRLKPGLFDRFLIVAARQALTPVLVVNKIDLTDLDTLKIELSVYVRLGVLVHFTSALKGTGVEDLRRLIRGKRAVFAGHSGVGKSTLLAALEPGLDIETRTVNRKTGKGVHTTSQVTLYETEGGGCLIDTPGVRAIGLWRVEPQEVDAFFEEITDRSTECRFRACSHDKEPDCAVKKAVEDGAIDVRRFESYRRICESLKEERRERGY